MCVAFKMQRNPGASCPPLGALLTPTFAFPSVHQTPAATGRAIAPLHSHPGPSRSVTPYLGWELTPAPRREQTGTLPCCQVNPSPHSPVRRFVPAATEQGGRAPLTCVGSAVAVAVAVVAAPELREQPWRGEGRASRSAAGLPWPPLASPALKGRRRPRVTFETPLSPARAQLRAALPGVTKRRRGSVLGTGWA